MLAVRNAVLSTAFAGMVLWGLDLIGALEFGVAALAFAPVCLFLLTHTLTQ